MGERFIGGLVADEVGGGGGGEKWRPWRRDQGEEKTSTSRMSLTQVMSVFGLEWWNTLSLTKILQKITYFSKRVR